MGRIQTDGNSICAHAINEGVLDTMLEGVLRFDPNEDGLAAVIDLKTVGKKTLMTPVLLDMVTRSLRSRSLVITVDGEEVRTEVDESRVLTRPVAPKRLKSIKRIPHGAQTMLERH